MSPEEKEGGGSIMICGRVLLAFALSILVAKIMFKN
jgi:hypothetical protein